MGGKRTQPTRPLSTPAQLNARRWLHARSLSSHLNLTSPPCDACCLTLWPIDYCCLTLWPVVHSPSLSAGLSALTLLSLCSACLAVSWRSNGRCQLATGPILVQCWHRRGGGRRAALLQLPLRSSTPAAHPPQSRVTPDGRLPAVHSSTQPHVGIVLTCADHANQSACSTCVASTPSAFCDCRRMPAARPLTCRRARLAAAHDLRGHHPACHKASSAAFGTTSSVLAAIRRYVDLPPPPLPHAARKTAAPAPEPRAKHRTHAPPMAVCDATPVCVASDSTTCTSARGSQTCKHANVHASPRMPLPRTLRVR